MSTSYQFVVEDDERNKLLTVKIYDKVLDLISREASKTVGSRMSMIIGSKNKLGELEKSIRKA